MNASCPNRQVGFQKGCGILDEIAEVFNRLDFSDQITPKHYWKQ